MSLVAFAGGFFGGQNKIFAEERAAQQAAAATAAENLNARFGLNRRSDVMFAPYSESNFRTWSQTGLSGIGTGLFNSDRLNSNDIMLYDPLANNGKGAPIKINGKIVRFKTGDDAFVKGGGANPTADEIIKFLKEKFNIEYDPLKP